MRDEFNAESFRLAPMSPLILTLTILLLALPAVFLVRVPALALVLLALYAWVWVRFRPSRFTVQRTGLQVTWPLKRRDIPREEIASVRVVDRRELRREIGWGVRVGAGGLWGGFGCLWTTRRGLVQMYISRRDGYVWIERTAGRPWLVTPEEPEQFVRALSR